jgi:hypothetical protein
MTTNHHPVQFEQGPDGEIVVNVPNIRVKLTKNTKGYQWEISCADDRVAVALHNTKVADDWLREHYGTTE